MAASPPPAEPELVAPSRPSPPRRSRRRTLVSGALLAAVVAAFAWALAGKWDQVVTEMRDQNPLVLLGSLVLCLLAVLMSFLIWRGTLAVLGSPVRVRPASRMFFVAQLGKYLPGSVWPVVVQMRLGRENGIPRQRMALAFLLTLGLSVLVGLLVGVAALPALVQAEGRSVLFGLLLLPVLLALLVPQVLNGLLNRGLRLLRRPPLDQPFSGRDMARGVAWTLAFWVVFGLHVWLLSVGLGASAWETLPVAIGGFAVAFSIGPLLVVLPAGAGVREAVLVVLLGSVLTAPEATAVALTSRGLLMLTDGLLALAAGLVPAPAPAAPAPACQGRRGRAIRRGRHARRGSGRGRPARLIRRAQPRCRRIGYLTGRSSAQPGIRSGRSGTLLSSWTSVVADTGVRRAY